MNKPFITTLICLALTASVAAQKWKRVLPHYIKTQFAGGIGFLSLGAGYENKKETIEADGYYGYVPKKLDGVTIHTATAKLTIMPFSAIGLKHFQYNLFSFGVLASYKFGKQYFLFDPEKYPYSYYGHPTALHAGVFVGGQIKKTFVEKNIKRIALYYEIGTTDKELISLLTNSSLELNEILNLAVGVKTSF